MSKSWFLPAPELVAGVCRSTKRLHRVVAVCGLILGGGGSLLELLDLKSDFLDMLGVIMGFVLGFSLLAIAPLTLLALIVCRQSRQLIVQNLLVWMFIGTLWFTDGIDLLVTTIFLGYALTVLSLWFREALSKKPTREPS